MWATIAIALAEWLGPILFDWFKTWLESRLNKKAAMFAAAPLSVPGLIGSTAIDAQAARLKLLQAVRDDLWFFQVGKRRMVDQCIMHVKNQTVIGADTPKVV